MCVYVLGTPETSLRGRSTRKALSAFTSKPSLIRDESTVLIILESNAYTHHTFMYCLNEDDAGKCALRFYSTRAMSRNDTITITNAKHST